VVAAFRRAGLEWLSNEGRRFGAGRGFLLLGLNQQVGRDAFIPDPEPPFVLLEAGGGPAFGRARSGIGNAFSHYDPDPAGLGDLGGPLAWSGYEVECEVRLESRHSEAGLVVLSRYPAGEDRMIVLARAAPGSGAPTTTFTHVPQPTLEAAWRGLDAVLAGHTHGGQVRLPGGLALITRTPLGPHFDRGVFDFAAPNARGWTRLYLNSGVGTSVLPVRFLCPPRYAVVEVGGPVAASD
jgi:hypothetical protein